MDPSLPSQSPVSFSTVDPWGTVDSYRLVPGLSHHGRRRLDGRGSGKRIPLILKTVPKQ